MESCLPNAFAHVEPCELVIIPGWAGMVTAHIFIKGGGGGRKSFGMHIFPWVKQCTRT